MKKERLLFPLLLWMIFSLSSCAYKTYTMETTRQNLDRALRYSGRVVIRTVNDEQFLLQRLEMDTLGAYYGLERGGDEVYFQLNEVEEVLFSDNKKTVTIVMLSLFAVISMAAVYVL